MKKLRDRKDGAFVKHTDPSHVALPLISPGRIANEATASYDIDLTNLDLYLKEKQKNGRKYSYMTCVYASLAIMFASRPKMNYYVKGSNYYIRKDIVFSMNVKRTFSDNDPSLNIKFNYDPKDERFILDQIQDKLDERIDAVKATSTNSGEKDPLDFLLKIPPFMLPGVGRFFRFLDNRGWLPKALMEVDPQHSSCFLANMASIGIETNYHHLTNWGTNSFFFLMGKIKVKNELQLDGTVVAKRYLPLVAIIDERIADGLYLTRSTKIIPRYLENPSLFDVVKE